MPSYYMQYYFSQTVKEHLSYAGQAAVELYPHAYLMGAFGFDMFESKVRLTAELDYKYAYEFFEYASSFVYESGSKVQLAYMLGLMTHYVLDSRMNPYLYYYLEKGVPAYFGGGRGFLRKEQIQDSLEAHIQKKGLIPFINSKVTKEEALEIGEIFESVLPYFTKYQVKSKKIASILLNYTIPNIMPFELHRYDYMNRQKTSWLTVRNGEWESDMSVDELLVKLIPIAVKMIDYLILKIRSSKPLDKHWFALNYQGILVSR